MFEVFDENTYPKSISASFELDWLNWLYVLFLEPG